MEPYEAGHTDRTEWQTNCSDHVYRWEKRNVYKSGSIFSDDMLEIIVAIIDSNQ
jgi:hypothetical protein